MVRKINTDLLDFLSDDDIKVLIQSFDLKWMLGPFKQNSKNYSKKRKNNLKNVLPETKRNC